MFWKISLGSMIFWSVMFCNCSGQVDENIEIVEVKEVEKQAPVVVVKDVSEEWKEEVTKQFDQDVTKIRQIIIDGESNKQDLKDFLNRFEDQKEWFDANVSATKNFFDPTYNAVMQKKLSFKRLVKAQERADEILKELVDEDKLSLPVKRQIRLAVLYNLNSLIQREVEKGRAELSESGLSDFDIRRVVTRVFGEIEKKRAEEREIERVVKKDIEDLERQIENFRKEMDVHKKEKDQLESKISTLEVGLEEKRKATKELEKLLKRVEEDKEMLKDEIARRTAFQTRKELKPVIERKNKENMDLQIHLKRIEKELHLLKSEVAPMKAKPKKVLNLGEKNEQKNLEQATPQG